MGLYGLRCFFGNGVIYARSHFEGKPVAYRCVDQSHDRVKMVSARSLDIILFLFLIGAKSIASLYTWHIKLNLLDTYYVLIRHMNNHFPQAVNECQKTLTKSNCWYFWPFSGCLFPLRWVFNAVTLLCFIYPTTSLICCQHCLGLFSVIWLIFRLYN